ncbi:preprotein translocase subunit SecD [Serratia liquefaciens]|nr:preprotein translocase subunit SecD [Serratia liquefaciens]
MRASTPLIPSCARAKRCLTCWVTKYVVALNLAPATPRWLAALYAEPMKLGLDLRGGVHFLMEVDMDTALGKLQEQNIDSLRSEPARQRHSLRDRA